MVYVYFFGNLELGLEILGILLECVNVIKFLGVYIDLNFKWEFYISFIFKFCYVILRILRKIRNFIDFKLWKYLVE